MYNNYGYNPYMQQNRFIGVPQQQPLQQVPQNLQSTAELQRPILNGLCGKIVDSIDTVKGIDIPLDGSMSYFPLASGESIVTKQLQIDGTSKIVVYKPIEESNKELPKYITMEDLNKEINKIDLSDIDDIKEEIKDLKQEIKDLKKKKKGDD